MEKQVAPFTVVAGPPPVHFGEFPAGLKEIRDLLIPSLRGFSKEYSLEFDITGSELGLYVKCYNPKKKSKHYFSIPAESIRDETFKAYFRPTMIDLAEASLVS